MISRSTIVAVAVVGLLVWPSPALADAVLVGSSPASNSTVGGTVSSVQLVFNEIVSDATIAIDAPGGPVVLDEVIDSGQVISASFPALTTEGRYIVRYAVMSADSDPVDGAFAFTYRVGAPEPLPVVAPALAEEGRDRSLGPRGLCWSGTGQLRSGPSGDENPTVSAAHVIQGRTL